MDFNYNKKRTSDTEILFLLTGGDVLGERLCYCQCQLDAFPFIEMEAYRNKD